MKKIRLLAGACVTLFVLLFAQPVFAQDTFEMAGTTLVTYHGTESVVNVPEGVTAIGEKAFYQNTSITEVKLPETLTYISTSAFQGCTSLQTINFPVGMIEIQNAAFKNCTSLQSAQFPRGLSSLGAQSFYNCTGLVDVFAYEHLGAIGSECFRYCDNLTVHCPQSSFIGGYAELIGAGTETFNYEATGDFILDGSLLVSYLGSDTEVTLPESVTEIGAYAFAGNTDITTLNITSQLSRIQPYAFFGCENLISVTAQTGIQRLDAYAFSGCSHLTNIALSGSYTIVPQGAFQGCNALTEVTLPSNVTLLSDYAFARCTALSALPQTGALAGIGNYAFSGCDGLTQVTLPDTVAWLGNAAFADCSYLTDFIFPTNLTDTGNKTLKNCVALESVLLPTGLRTVGTSVFEGCTSLFEVSLPDTVTTIGAKAFKSTKLTLLSFPDDLTTIGDQAFYGALNDISVFVPASVAYFGDDVFGACQDIIIQCYYQSDAFEYAASNGIDYELVGDADNPFLIDDGALIRYFGLDTEVTIPEEVTIIGENAFMNKTAMVSVNLPDGLIEIQKGAFENCRSLTSIFLPAGVTGVGSEAFANCTGLTELAVVGADTAFEADAFLGAADFIVNIYFGADAETYFLAKGYTVIYLEDDEPVENIVLNDYPSSVLGDEGVVISGQVLKHGQIAPNADYRIAYRLEGDAWWTYHSTDFQPCGDDGGFNETIRLPEEGRYTFLIEAKTSASTTAEIAEETQTTAVYFKAFPVSQIVSLSADKAALLAGEEIGLSFEIEYEKEAQPVQLCIEYSLDGETWSHTGSEWSEPIMLGGNSGTVLFATPSDLPEGEYTIRLSLRADGREAADVSAECTAWLYQVMPIKSVAFTEEPGTWVATSAGITLSAAAEGYAGYETNAQYCFYYAYNGGAFKKLRGWGSDATVVFKPRSEGAYVFKVEAKSGGRASVDAEYTTKTQMVYLGAVPASNLEVAVEKESFEYGEPIKVNIMLEEGRDEQTTLYQVQYAKAGSKRFYGLTEWEEYALEEGQVWLKTHVLIPPNRLDATYQIRVVVKTVGRKKADVYETKEVMVCVGEALGTVALMPMDNIIVMDGRGLMLQAEAQKSDGTQAYAEYRFSYRVSGTRGWKYISKKFAYSSESAVFLKKEGVYDFRVEAKAAGDTLVQTDTIAGVQVYHGAIPAQSVSIDLAADRDELLADERVELIVSGMPCDDERYQGLEYCVLVSTNGKSFKKLSGYDFGEYDGVSEIALPAIKKDMVYYLKVGVRTEERGGMDAVSKAVRVERYLFLPADAVTLTIGGESPQVVPADGVLLSAQGYRENEAYPCTYRFFYRVAGTRKWLMIKSADKSANSVAFIPKKEGEYEFFVQATAVGRTKIDIASEISEPKGLYFNDLPATFVSLDLGEKTKAVYSEDIPLNITAATDTALEYQLLISTNGKRWKALPEYATYQPLMLDENGHAQTSINLSSRRDYTYYIRVNVRAAGRQGADVYSDVKIDMYRVMPIESVVIEDITEQENGQLMISAQTEQAAGYEAMGYVPLYQFYYRVAGTSRWRAITRSTLNNTCVFTPTKEAYDFKVRAVNTGRKKTDVESIIYDYTIGAE